MNCAELFPSGVEAQAESGLHVLVRHSTREDRVSVLQSSADALGPKNVEVPLLPTKLSAAERKRHALTAP